MTDWRVWVMFAVGLTLIWLAVYKKYEPNLLLPMGFGCLLANIPQSSAVGGGFKPVVNLALVYRKILCHYNSCKTYDKERRQERESPSNLADHYYRAERGF